MLVRLNDPPSLSYLTTPEYYFLQYGKDFRDLHVNAFYFDIYFLLLQTPQTLPYNREIAGFLKSKEGATQGFENTNPVQAGLGTDLITQLSSYLDTLGFTESLQALNQSRGNNPEIEIAGDPEYDKQSGTYTLPFDVKYNGETIHELALSSTALARS